MTALQCGQTAKKEKSKMANEIELAEELSNSEPERAMELLSSIGEPNFSILNIIFALIVQFYVSKWSCSECKINFS